MFKCVYICFWFTVTFSVKGAKDIQSLEETDIHRLLDIFSCCLKHFFHNVISWDSLLSKGHLNFNTACIAFRILKDHTDFLKTIIVQSIWYETKTVKGRMSTEISGWTAGLSVVQIHWEASVIFRNEDLLFLLLQRVIIPPVNLSTEQGLYEATFLSSLRQRGHLSYPPKKSL